MEISEQRKYLNECIYPRLEDEFLPQEGGKVLDVGKSGGWDYNKHFKRSKYIVSDIDPELKPDVVDDIRHSSFPDESFDLIIFNGVYEQISGGELAIRSAFKELRRILKIDGILVCGIVGSAYPQYAPHRDKGNRITNCDKGVALVSEFCDMLETKAFYDNGLLRYLYVIGKKRQ